MSNLSRRSIVASAAALPALAVPAVALASTELDRKAELDRIFGSEPDPIFAAIEAYERAEDISSKAYEDRDEALDRFEDEYGLDDPRRTQ
jgi:hypothetical protein